MMPISYHRLLPGLLAFAMGFAAPEGHAQSGTVIFSTRDQLTGDLTGLTTDQAVWTSPVLEKPVPFFLKRIQELNLPSLEPERNEGHETVVTLTNGDTLAGQLISVTDDAIELKTWYAGVLKFNRLMVRSVRIDDRPKVIYRGPKSLEEWTLTKGRSGKTGWIYDLGALQAVGPGGVAKDVGLPMVCRIAFSLEWRSAIQLRMLLGSSQPEQLNPTEVYELTMDRHYVAMRRRSERSMANLNQQGNQLNGFISGTSTRVEIYCDRKAGNFFLFVDGKVASQWNDPDLKDVPNGGVLHFVSQSGNMVRISRLEVTEWDGHTDDTFKVEDMQGRFGGVELPTPAPAVTLSANQMQLRNGDVLTGEVLSIVDSIVQVKTSFGEVKLPVSRLRSVALKPVDLEVPKIRNGDIRAWFADGSRVVFRLDSASTEELTGYSQTFGNATFKLNAFNRIEFNLYDPEFQKLRGEKDW
jgi:hypothetical protein